MDKLKLKKVKGILHPETDSDMVMVGDVPLTDYLEQMVILQSHRTYPQFLTMCRADQLANLEYTTTAPIFSAPNGTSIAAGTKKGVLYSDAYEHDKYVGVHVSIKTFMTAVNNPYSVVYTENMAKNTSEYGFTYVSGQDSHLVGGMYGTACNMFIAYALKQRLPICSFNYDYFAKTDMIKEKTGDAQFAEIGDVLWKSGHVMLVYDVEKDKHGKVVNVTIKESTYPFPQTQVFTAEVLNSYFKNSGWKMYKYNWIDESIDYDASEFVAVGDESTPAEYEYNDDICTYLGDYACIREGFPMFLNYNLKSIGKWNSVEIYKDNQLIDTLPIDINGHRIRLSTDYAFGKYKARLKNGSNYSDYTYWEVIETGVILTKDENNVITAQLTSANGRPLYCYACRDTTYPKGHRLISDEERAKRKFTFTVESLTTEQGLSPSGGNNLKVFFKGDYGVVACEMINLDDL